MSRRERNLEAFGRAHPGLEERVPTAPARAHGRGPREPVIQASASGEPTATSGGSYVHSRYDPVREAERTVASSVADGVTTAVFCGFGLGYQVEAFLRQCPGVPGVVIEPDLAMFSAALDSRDLAGTLAAPELFWHLGEEIEAIVTSLEALPLGQLRVLRLPGSPPRSREHFRRVERAIRMLLDRREVNLNTLSRFGKLWVRNLTANLAEFVACPGVAELRGRFEGFPALVLAAGPSLDEVLPRLGELRERMLLVAVDTSFRLACEAGVEPDLLVTVDPQYWNTRHLDWASIERAILLSESSAHPRLFRQSGAESAALYFVSSFFPLGRMIEEAFGSRGQVGAGGSVATTAWDLAQLLGCRPLHMAGLDLGYPGLRTHCRGAFFEERTHHDSRRLQPAESAQFRALHEAGPFLLENDSGGLTLTDRRLVIYKWWFESQLARREALDRAPTFRLSPGGIRIDGMRRARLEELLALPPCRAPLDAALAGIRERGLRQRREGGRSGQAAAVSLLGELATDLGRLRELSSRGARTCGRLRGLDRESAIQAEAAAGLFLELEGIDRDILELSSRNVAGFLFQGLIHRIVDAPGGRRTLAEVLELSEALYLELESSSSYHLELIQGFVRRAAVR